MTIVWIALIFGIVIMIHELGHFLTAKLFGVKVETFSIGFGKKLLKKRIGETEYCLSALPVGGYVKFAEPDHIEDVDPNNPEHSRCLPIKPAWQRALIFVAGVSFNLILAIAIASGLNYAAGKKMDVSTAVKTVQKNSPASKAGFQKGDIIVAINGVKASHWQDVSILISDNVVAGEPDRPINFTVSRQGRLVNLATVPKFIKEENRVVIGIAFTWEIKEIKGWPAAVAAGAQDAWNLIYLQAKALYWLVTKKISSKSLGGPVAIVKATGQAVQGGLVVALSWLFTFNVLLAFMNLLPILPLDGGHLLFLLIGVIRGRPLSKLTQERIASLGFVLLILLMIIATTYDVERLGKP